jgi:SAM-dependent MidA family methyltransferase
MWRALDSPSHIDLIELGPGRGLFARDVLEWSARQFPEFSRALRYGLVEQSTHLRTRLQERLQEHIAAGNCRVVETIEAFHSDLSHPFANDGRNDGNSGDLIVFANEFFDALPVEVVDYRGSLRVGYENGRFVEGFTPPCAGEDEFLDRYGVHPEMGERVEAPLASLGWMERIAAVFRGRRGFLVVIDYGYTREEQLAGRHRDTIMSYRQHTASNSPYEAPGEQDITAHVNFTALRAKGVACGFEALALLTQFQFLFGIGEETQFADAFQDCKLPQGQTKVALQLKHLISPGGMGETFQVLVMSHNVAAEKAASLSGLKLAR